MNYFIVAIFLLVGVMLIFYTLMAKGEEDFYLSRGVSATLSTLGILSLIAGLLLFGYLALPEYDLIPVHNKTVSQKTYKIENVDSTGDIIKVYTDSGIFKFTAKQLDSSGNLDSAKLTIQHISHIKDTSKFIYRLGLLKAGKPITKTSIAYKFTGTRSMFDPTELEDINNSYDESSSAYANNGTSDESNTNSTLSNTTTASNTKTAVTSGKQSNSSANNKVVNNTTNNIANQFNTTTSQSNSNTDNQSLSNKSALNNEINKKIDTYQNNVSKENSVVRSK